jgi:hypothetical protein
MGRRKQHLLWRRVGESEGGGGGGGGDVAVGRGGGGDVAVYRGAREGVEGGGGQGDSSTVGEDVYGEAKGRDFGGADRERGYLVDADLGVCTSAEDQVIVSCEKTWWRGLVSSVLGPEVSNLGNSEKLVS